MTKKELIAKISETTDFTQKDTRVMLDALTQILVDVAVSGDKVTLDGVGTICSKESAEKEAYNIKTQRKEIIPAHNTLKFKFSPTLKQAYKKAN